MTSSALKVFVSATSVQAIIVSATLRMQRKRNNARLTLLIPRVVLASYAGLMGVVFLLQLASVFTSIDFR